MTTRIREYKTYEHVPIDEWPGEDTTEDDVWLASRDERDWFSHPSRLQAFHDYRNRLDMGWQRRKRGHWGRRKPPPKFDFAQIGVVGDMGTGKTTIVGSEGVFWGQFGYPFFSVYNPDNQRSSWLMGKKIHPAELYEIIEVLPMHSILAVDEGHTFFESGLGMASGIRGWQIQGAGLRKALCRVYIPTALMVLLAPTIRRSCSEVWRPIKLEVDDHRIPEKKLPPHSDPKNFVQVWDMWGGFPFRQRDIIEARARRPNGGLGKPHRTLGRQGEVVRTSFKLTDTFLRVAGAQAQQFALKAQQEEVRENRRQEREETPALTREQQAVLIAAWETCHNGYSTHFTGGSIAHMTGIRRSQVSEMLTAFLSDLPDIQTGKGYRCDRVKLALPVKFSLPDVHDPGYRWKFARLMDPEGEPEGEDYDLC